MCQFYIDKYRHDIYNVYVITIITKFIVAEFIVDSAHIKADMAIEKAVGLISFS